jgi:Ca2+-binding RTX toxin-like protein
MARSLLQVILRSLQRRAAKRPNRPAPRFAPEVVSLEHREVPAVTAVFTGGALAVFGDNSGNMITLSRTAAGNILVNGGAVRVLGGTPTVTNTFNITAFGRGGNDAIALDEANGPLPSAILFGGAGNDALTGGAAFNVLYGGAGNDTLLGRGGADILFGGAGSDALTGGSGNDLAFGEAGDDVLVWNPGDGSDLNDGGAGRDETRFNGNDADEIFAIAANGPRARLTRDVGGIVMDLNGIEVVTVNALGGADTVTVNDLSGTGVTDVNLNLFGAGGGGLAGVPDGKTDTVIVAGTAGDDSIFVAGSTFTQVLGLAATVSITGTDLAADRLEVRGLAGDDEINGGGQAADGMLFTADGGGGNDVLIGGAGNDTLRGGDGDDVLVGGPGDDILDGGPGDNLLFP